MKPMITTREQAIGDVQESQDAFDLIGAYLRGQVSREVLCRSLEDLLDERIVALSQQPIGSEVDPEFYEGVESCA